LLRTLSAAAFTLILIVVSASAATVGHGAALEEASDESMPSVITHANVEDLVDRTVTAYMRDHHIAGVTVSVVDRNGSLLEKGYGIATLNPQRPVDPTRSLFALGSISKTFSALAAMQLAGAGKIDMDADVNRYLPTSLQLPDDGFPPVRVRDLLTHSAGFEDSVIGNTIYAPEATVPSLDDYLARVRPHRVRAPGLRAVYGNYASGLLGSIVAHVSGESYEDYVDTHILAPLDMRHTTFREPLPAQDPRNLTGAMLDDLSPGFTYKNGVLRSAPQEHVAQANPFDGGRSSAADMARYMRFWLSNGTLDGHQLLSENDFRTMTTINFRNIPDEGALAIAHGFIRKRYGRYLSLEKSGDTLIFSSQIVMLPEAGLGVFVSVNTNGQSDNLRDLLPTQLFKYLLPDSRPTVIAPTSRNDEAALQRFVGLYLDERRNYSTLEKAVGVLIGFVTERSVGIAADGNLSIDGKSAAQTGPLSFTVFKPEEFAGEVWHFVEDEQGRIVALSPGGAAYYDRLGFLDDRHTLRLALRATVILSLIVLPACIWRIVRARKSPSSVSSRRINIVAVISAVLWLAFFVTFLVALSALDSDWTVGMAGCYPSVTLKAAIALGYLAATATVLLNLSLPSVWRSGDCNAGLKSFLTVVALTMLVSVVLLVRWNVLGAPLMIGA